MAHDDRSGQDKRSRDGGVGRWLADNLGMRIGPAFKASDPESAVSATPPQTDPAAEEFDVGKEGVETADHDADRTPDNRALADRLQTIVDRDRALLAAMTDTPRDRSAMAAQEDSGPDPFGFFDPTSKAPTHDEEFIGMPVPETAEVDDAMGRGANSGTEDSAPAYSDLSTSDLSTYADTPSAWDRHTISGVTDATTLVRIADLAKRLILTLAEQVEILGADRERVSLALLGHIRDALAFLDERDVVPPRGDDRHAADLVADIRWSYHRNQAKTAVERAERLERDLRREQTAAEAATVAHDIALQAAEILTRRMRLLIDADTRLDAPAIDLIAGGVQKAAYDALLATFLVASNASSR